MPTDVEQAESSTATEPKPLEQFTETQRAEWLKSGKVPQAKAASPPAEEAAEEVEAEDVTDPSPEPKLSKKAESRFQQLANENKRLREEFDRLKNGVKPDPPPEKKAEPKLEAPKKPVEADFSDWNAFQEAKDKYFEDLADYKAQVAIQKDRADRVKESKETETTRVNQEIEKSWKQRVDESKKVHGDYEEICFRTENGKPVVTIPLNAAADHYLLVRPEGAEMLYFLASNPDIAEKLYELDQFDTVEALGEIRKSFKVDHKEERVIPKVTKASPPPRELGGGRTAADDPALGAVKDGDFLAYKRAQDLADLKRKKGTG